MRFVFAKPSDSIGGFNGEAAVFYYSVLMFITTGPGTEHSGTVSVTFDPTARVSTHQLNSALIDAIVAWASDNYSVTLDPRDIYIFGGVEH